MAQVGKSQHSQPEWFSRILQGARSHKVLLAIVGSALIVVCGFAGVRIMNHSSTSSIIATTSSITARAGMPHTALTAPDSAEQATSAAPLSSIWVHVDGAVAVPDVYEIAGAHPRCNDAVARAGGVTDDADTSAINLAAELHDGEKLHIPRSGETPAADADGAYAPSGSSSVAAEQKTGSAGHDAGDRFWRSQGLFSKRTAKNKYEFCVCRKAYSAFWGRRFDRTDHRAGSYRTRIFFFS